MYDEYDDGEGGRSPVRIIATVVGALAIVAAGWFLVKPRLTGDDDGEQVTQAEAVSTVTDPGADAAESTDAETDEADAPATTEESPTTTEAPATTDAPTTTAAPATTAAPTTAATTVPPAPAGPVGYDTLPDGSPVPVVAIFDVDTIVISGAVPDQAAVERLTTLAIANSKTPAGVANYMTINPNVPRTVPVRVIELTSARFPEASAEILPDHARELDRVVTIMNALPKISVLVVGHADQRGDDLGNLAISEQRAAAVVSYLVAHGIDVSRVASRAVGEADLLSLNNDAAALALNRRTEFVFTGLLAE